VATGRRVRGVTFCGQFSPCLCDRRTAVGKMSDRSQRRPRRHRSSAYHRIITYIAYAAYISLTGARARKEATVAASYRPVACPCRLCRAGSGGAHGAGWPSALHSAPLGRPERRVGHSGHSAAFGLAGPGREGRGGWNGAGRSGGVSPGGAGVAEAYGTASGDSDKRNFYGQSASRLDLRSRVADYRSMRPFSTLVT
jgi:hypothetical protein